MFMQHFLANQFNKGAANPKNQAMKIIQVLNIHPGQKIIDLGSGGGFFTFEFSKLVGPSGKVYPIDTNPNFLSFIKDKTQQQAFTNIEPVLVKDTSILPIPEKSIDLIFTRNVYHHLKNRIVYFKSLSQILKPNSQIVIIDYSKDGLISFLRTFGHYTDKNVLLIEMQHAGYSVVQSYDFLNKQSFIIFKL